MRQMSMITKTVMMRLLICKDISKKRKKKANKLVKNKALDNKPSMDRISEVEEDKYNTIIDKYNDGLNRDEFNIDDKNFDDFMNRNINSSNLKDFDPNFNNTDSTYRFKQDMSQNNKTNIIDIKRPKTQLQSKRVEVKNLK